MASQITGKSTVWLGWHQRKHQCPRHWPFVGEIHRWTVDSPYKGPVTRKAFPCHDVILYSLDFRVAGARMNSRTPKLPDDSSLVSDEGRIERVTWSNPAEFLLSCIDYAVGFSNLWRFPYLWWNSGCNPNSIWRNYWDNKTSFWKRFMNDHGKLGDVMGELKNKIFKDDMEL